jgi:hypothetical protein
VCKPAGDAVKTRNPQPTTTPQPGPQAGRLAAALRKAIADTTDDDVRAWLRRFLANEPTQRSGLTVGRRRTAAKK